ncbi:MAG: hypothetical protein IPG94_22255 [Kineosporiaceae bacterium]|nr:hypothetical protein [Kineosporiaceae bacterium]
MNKRIIALIVTVGLALSVGGTLVAQAAARPARGNCAKVGTNAVYNIALTAAGKCPTGWWGPVATGANGATGASGAPGAKGDVGPAGPQGQPGKDGKDGKDGGPGRAEPATTVARPRRCRPRGCRGGEGCCRERGRRRGEGRGREAGRGGQGAGRDRRRGLCAGTGPASDPRGGPLGALGCAHADC